MIGIALGTVRDRTSDAIAGGDPRLQSVVDMALLTLEIVAIAPITADMTGQAPRAHRNVQSELLLTFST